MSDPPRTNAAIDLIRRLYDNASRLTAPPTRGTPVTDDFYLLDRRSGVPNYGRIESADYDAFTRAIWEISPGGVRLSVGSVVAVVGERLAAYVEVIEADLGRSETLMCVWLDADHFHLKRWVMFDLDDIDAARAELDAMDAESGA